MIELRKLSLLVFILMCGLSSVYAQPRNEEEALEMAANCMEFSIGSRSSVHSASNSLQLVSPARINEVLFHKSGKAGENRKTDAGFYIFNDLQNQKFIIISGDKRQEDCLGISDNGLFNTENIPCGLLTFLEQYNREFEYLQKNNISEENENVSYPPTAYNSTSPLIKTKWDQGKPYNTQCPVVYGEYCATGCVATAMAQLMNYHAHPDRGYGIVERNPGKNRLSADRLDLSKRAFNWADLANREKITVSSPSNVISAVAYLMKACGYAIFMDYGTSAQGSGAYSNYVPDVMKAYFDYSQKATFIFKTSYSTSKWEQMIQNELQNNRPILYRGDGTGGHAFILDGYRSSDGTYHFNWGWSGANDGYYRLTSLRPNVYNFSNSQGMAIGLYPANAVTIAKPVIDINKDYDQVTISCATEGVTFYYSFTPQDQSTTSSYQRYYANSIIPIDRNGTYRAYVEKNGKKAEADPKSVTWYKVTKPEFYPDGNKITIKCPSATSIYYTTNATASTTSYTKYTSPITVTDGTKVKAFGRKANYNDSDISSYEYKEEIKTVYDIHNTAGQISKKISNASKMKVVSLTVSGELNGTDIAFIRDMLERGELSRLDISNASIVSGGNSYFASVTTTNNVIGRLMFSFSPKLSHIKIPSNIIEIGDNAFDNCPSLTSIEIPSTCQKIGSSAFKNSGLTSLVIPKNVSSIGYTITEGCSSLKSLKVENGNNYYDSRNNCNAIIETSKNELICGCISSSIPEGVSNIGMSSFASSPSKLTVPSGVNFLSYGAFEGNEHIEEIYIRDTPWLYIEWYCFSNCTSLRKVTMPKNVKDLGKKAFENCTSLRSFTTFGETPLEIGSDVFEGSSYKSAILYVPYGSAEKYRSAAVWKDFMSIVEMEPVLNSISEVKSMADNTNATLTLDNAQVIYTYSSYNYDSDYIYLRDKTGCLKIFGSIFSCIDLKEGDILVGTIPIMKASTGNLFRSYVYNEGDVKVSGYASVYPHRIVFGTDSISADDDENFVELKDVTAELSDNSLLIQSPSYPFIISASPLFGIGIDTKDKILSSIRNNVFNGRKINLTGILSYTSYEEKASCMLSLTQPVEFQDTIIVINSTSATLNVGETIKLEAFISPSDATNNSFIWSADNSSIASVSENGVVTAVGEGQTTITCKTNDGHGISATCIVTVFNPTIKGDVNEDRSVNGTDLVTLSNIILGKSPEKASADVNGNGQVNGTDYVALANIILGKSASRMTTGENITVDGTATLHLNPFAISPGETKELTVCLTNPDNSLTLLQFDMVLPNGLTVQKRNDDYQIDMARRTSQNSHQLTAHNNNGVVRFLLVSSSNELMEGSEGAVVRLMVTADMNFDGGAISLQNILGVSPDEEEVYMPTGHYNLVGGTTHIYNIGMNNIDSTVYSLSGQRLTAPKKGINIIDGKKVVVK